MKDGHTAIQSNQAGGMTTRLVQRTAFMCEILFDLIFLRYVTFGTQQLNISRYQRGSTLEIRNNVVKMKIRWKTPGSGLKFYTFRHTAAASIMEIAYRLQ
jgi:hypothetical protein